jgi:2-polyprenyl-6-methoxyphenol hydroxylase-like FAD-dependent oxidoreductase
MGTSASDNVTKPSVGLRVDVAVIGAGTAGTCAAAAMSRRGISVALIDIHPRHPADFRAEKIGQAQMDYFEAFGLGEAAYRQMTPFDGVWVHRFNRIVEKKTTREYASHYPDIVNALRGALPQDVQVVIGRVDTIETGSDRQRLVLADGGWIEARLLVVATGLGDTIRRKLGIEKVITNANHSLAFGFDLVRPPSDFPFPSLVWTAERPVEKAAYLTLFPIGERMRANFFTYRDVTEPWSHAFRKDPATVFDALFPRFEPLFGRLEAASPVTARPIDLLHAENHRQPGIVLLGDAFFTVCPSSGTGMDKALHDVARLADYLPKWLATPGMGSDKIAQFYADARKRATDAHAINISRRARSMRMDGALIWRARRLRSAVLTRGVYRARDLLRPLAPLRSATR